MPEEPHLCLVLATVPGREPAEYAKATLFVEKAHKSKPEYGGIHNTMGVAQFRSGRFAESAATLSKSLVLNRNATKVDQPSDLAFLAMSQSMLGKRSESDATYARLGEAMKRPEFAKDREATNLIRPMTLPVDPFQP